MSDEGLDELMAWLGKPWPVDGPQIAIPQDKPIGGWTRLRKIIVGLALTCRLTSQEKPRRSRVIDHPRYYSSLFSNFNGNI